MLTELDLERLLICRVTGIGRRLGDEECDENNLLKFYILCVNLAKFCYSNM